METLELIDCKLKGNLIRLYFGKNGEQRGDDWDDIPYEYNAGRVYHNFVDMMVDVAIDFNVEVFEPADIARNNSNYCRNDFKDRKIYAFEIIPLTYCQGGNREILKIFFGDTLQDILYHFQMEKIKIHITDTFVYNKRYA